MNSPQLRFLSLSSTLMLSLALSPSFAQDKDDELKAGPERIVFQTELEDSSELEKAFPSQSQEIRAFISQHVQHANLRDIDAYMADFYTQRLISPELEREYALRAMALKDLNIDIQAFYFERIEARAATVHVRQLASYLDPQGKRQRDHSIISYKVQKNLEDDRWVISASDRRRVETSRSQTTPH